MKHRNLTKAERHKISRLHQLLEEGRMIRATFIECYRTCGKPNCKCARGEKHRSVNIGQSKGGAPRSLHVPHDWEKRVEEWVERRREIDGLLEELSDLCWERLRRRKE